MMHRLVLAALLLLVAAATSPAAVSAADPISAQVSKIENKFPTELVFTATASTTAGEVKSVRFHMTTGRALVERVDNFDIKPGRSVSGTYTLKVAGTNYLPPGSTLTYWAEVQDTAGNTMLTEKQQYWYADTRFEWSKLQDGAVTLYYYGGAEASARNVLKAVLEVQGNTGKLLGVDANPFTVMVYNGARDIIGAQQEETSATRAQELIKVGVAYPGSDLVQILGAGSATGAADTARHETTHLFEHWAAGNSLPTWLDEGLAVWAQADPGSDYRGSLNKGIQNDTLLLVRGMESFPGKSDEVLLAYGQSWSLVKYLIDTYGREKYRTLYERLPREGTENVLKSLYGLSYDDLDAKWRQSVGAKPRTYGSARPTAVPVFGGSTPDAPSSAPANPEPAPAASGSAPLPVVPLAAGGVVLLVVVIIAAVTMGRGKKPA